MDVLCLLWRLQRPFMFACLAFAASLPMQHYGGKVCIAMPLNGSISNVNTESHHTSSNAPHFLVGVNVEAQVDILQAAAASRVQQPRKVCLLKR